MQNRMITFLILIILFVFASGQDLNIFGKFELVAVPIDAKELSRIKSKCFSGFGFPSCRPVYQQDPFVKAKNLVYYNNLENLYGSLYCMQCCGAQPNHQDVWDLYCDVDVVTAKESNMYGTELRLYANQFSGDTNIVRCPVRRSICNYDQNGEYIDCPNQANDPLTMVGYTLTLEINRIDHYFTYWRGVQSCKIDVEESPIPLDPNNGGKFRETIIVNHHSSFSDLFDVSKLAIVMLCTYLICYGTFYYFRRRKCVYCGNKLVFSDEMCHRCKFVGAHPPDPVLLAALESKGEHLQGVLPEVFPHSTEMVAFYRSQRDILKAAFSKLTKGEVATFPENAVAPPDPARPDDKDDDSVGVKSLGTLDTDQDMHFMLEQGKKQEATSAKIAVGTASSTEAKTGDDDTVASAVDGNKRWLNFFPFRWKYPKWMVKYLGFSNKKKEVVPYINPNLINLPKHIIYEAVGHHDPPKPDAEYLAWRRNFFEERLGYVPDDLHGAEHGEEQETELTEEQKEAAGDQSVQGSTAGSVTTTGSRPKPIPAWQKRQKPRAPPPPIPPEPGLCSCFGDLCQQSDLSKIRNAYSKSRNKRDGPPLKLILKTSGTICVLLILFAGLFIYGFQIDITEYVKL